MHGQDAVRAALEGFYGSIRALRHELLALYEGAGSTAVEANVHYTRLDGSVLVLPCVTVLRWRGELVADDRIFMDVTPLIGGNA